MITQGREARYYWAYIRIGNRLAALCYLLFSGCFVRVSLELLVIAFSVG